MLTQKPVPVRMRAPLAAALAVALLCAVFQALDWSGLLRYERDLIATGQPWRLLTGHFVHLGWPHWWLNAAGLGLIVALFAESMRPARLAACLLFSSLIVGAGLYLFSPGVGWYVGLSGSLHGLFVAGLLVQWREQPRLSWTILAVLTGKLVYEHAFGPLPGSEASAGGPVVVAAHTYGAVGGVLYRGLERGLGYAWAKSEE